MFMIVNVNLHEIVISFTYSCMISLLEYIKHRIGMTNLVSDTLLYAFIKIVVYSLSLKYNSHVGRFKATTPRPTFNHYSELFPRVISILHKRCWSLVPTLKFKQEFLYFISTFSSDTVLFILVGVCISHFYNFHGCNAYYYLLKFFHYFGTRAFGWCN